MIKVSGPPNDYYGRQNETMRRRYRRPHTGARLNLSMSQEVFLHVPLRTSVGEP